MIWWREAVQNLPYPLRVLAGMTVPILGLMSAAIFVLFAYALFSLSTQGIVFGWVLPPNVPLWAGMLGLFVVYYALTAPLKAGRYAAYHAAAAWYAPWAGVLETAFLILLFWLAYFYVPEFRVMLHSIVIVVRALFRSGAG